MSSKNKLKVLNLQGKILKEVKDLKEKITERQKCNDEIMTEKKT